MHRISGVPVWFAVLTALFMVLAAACSEMETEAGQDVSDLVGTWRFVTTGDYEGYVNGSLKITASADGQTTCKLTVYQSEFGSAVEKCRITASGEEILIDIEEVVSSSVPNWRKEAFRLFRTEDEMIGQVRIVVDFPVQFTRKK